MFRDECESTLIFFKNVTTKIYRSIFYHFYEKILIEYELTDLVRESARECRLKVLRYVMTESQIYSRPA